MPDQFGEKSQDPTPHRRQKAREEGQVAKSQDLASAAILFVAIVGLKYLGPRGVATFMGWMEASFREPQLALDSQEAIAIGGQTANLTGQMLLPVLGLLLLAAIVAHLSQTGFLFLPAKLGFDASRINPWKGLQRIASLSNSVRLGFGLVKVALVAGIAALSIWHERALIFSLGFDDLPSLAATFVNVTLTICLKIAAALLVLAILEFAFQRWKHEQDLKMTPQEVREEMKTLQGDPQVIARRRQVQRQLALSRLSTQVPTADVVVTNPTELAIALKYDPDSMAAPLVVAKGAGTVAQRIRRLALEHDIPVIERKPLARALYAEVEVNQPVPSEQYAAVAEVLRYVYELKGLTIPAPR